MALMMWEESRTSQYSCQKSSPGEKNRANQRPHGVVKAAWIPGLAGAKARNPGASLIHL